MITWRCWSKTLSALLATSKIVTFATRLNTSQGRINSSSSTRNVAQYFDGRLMSWKEMADHYLDEPETTSLIRADAIHSKDAGGKNNEGKLCGDALITAYVEGKRFQVGRAGGLTGRYFARDVEDGSWRNQLYETSSAPLEELNSNWFTLEAFVSETSRAMK